MHIAVYCASTIGGDPCWREAAERLGRWIAENGHTLVYGGGDTGLMGIVARQVFSLGGAVIGVLPGNVSFICARPQPYCTQVITETDMSARKARMLALADAFIALPGGIGTLDEITEAITLTRIGVQEKPSALYDARGFYAPLMALFSGMKKAGIMGEGDLRHVCFSDSPEEIGAFFDGWIAEREKEKKLAAAGTE